MSDVFEMFHASLCGLLRVAEDHSFLYFETAALSLFQSLRRCTDSQIGLIRAEQQ